jgi:hypothetical protein
MSFEEFSVILIAGYLILGAYGGGVVVLHGLR